MNDIQYTHRKRSYPAHCLQWNGDNTEQVLALLGEAFIGPQGSQGTAVLHDDHHIIVRHWAESRMDTLCRGHWVVKGKNGQVKCYDDPTFRTKYELMPG